MTNHVIDIKNSDCVLIMGANPASNHPMVFRWITQAMERGGKLIVVDPRFTRSASKSDIYAKMRSGTDIAFLGGMINYILENNLYHKEYVVEYTDASFLVDTGFKGAGDLNGLFSGYNESKRSYDKSTWKYQVDENGIPKRDKTLSDPNCVFQIMKQHYSRYSIDAVCKITGTLSDNYTAATETYAATGKPGKAGTILYAM